ncbi:Berberine bridge enzyme-like 6 [Colletotrichum gloeosporioides]|uniref:Berberine bridge enzyme-like 6 n=1 Tax=Colletotrichum gloeosporioides TaxID=474922 RepID=A0A8H4CI04_COLGL|nr:Berberine bridge enzyme-like 6 [Colletotrichum gloeosporioides]KAF3804358.1 Berberine bridge enzyme-like 6 [Colletotrichum gloeosporioides]
MVRLSSFVAFAAASLAPFTQAQDLETCLETAGLITSFPETNASFPNDIRSWQRRITPTPAGVAWPRTTPEVAAALACAREAKVLVAARDGGHCYGSYSLPTAGLTINMTHFQNVSYDDTTGLLTYGGGGLVSPVVSWLWKEHGARFPHVRANMVGLAGSSIGGGFGSLSRMLGTPMDYLEGATYMLYNGTIAECSRTKNPDLFWALQGAGSSYGIILDLTTKTWKPTFEKAIDYTITLNDTSLTAGVDALLAIQEHVIIGEWPDELTLRWSLTAPPFTGSGFYWGNPDDFDALMAPLMAKLPAGTNLTRNINDFWATENVATPSIDIPVDTYPPRSFYLQALVLRADQPFTKESASALYEHTTLAFNRTDLTKFGFIDLWGGKPARALKDEDTSFAHANSLWLIRWEGRLATGLTDFPADGLTYMQNGLEPFRQQLTTEGVPLRGFVNYRDTALSVDQWSERLYGKNYAKLQQLKTVYDPEGMFTAHPQSIPLPGQEPPAAIN